MELDKRYLLCYTELDEYGIRRARHSWFLTEKELLEFLDTRKAEKKAEVELAIEILNYRVVE